MKAEKWMSFILSIALLFNLLSAGTVAFSAEIKNNTTAENTNNAENINQFQLPTTAQPQQSDTKTVKLSWEITNIEVTETVEKTWDTEKLNWVITKSSATVNKNGSATFKFENCSDTKVNAQVSFQTENGFNGTATYDVTDGTVTLGVADSTITAEQTDTSKAIIHATVTPADGDFNGKSGVGKYGTYTVQISEEKTEENEDDLWFDTQVMTEEPTDVLSIEFSDSAPEKYDVSWEALLGTTAYYNEETHALTYKVNNQKLKFTDATLLRPSVLPATASDEEVFSLYPQIATVVGAPTTYTTIAQLKSYMISKEIATEIGLEDSVSLYELLVAIASVLSPSVGFNNVTTISGLEYWDVSEVTDFSEMFADLTELTDVSGIKNWDTSSAVNMNKMFNRCKKITSMDLSGWNVSKVTDFSYMFNGLSELTGVSGIENWNTSSAVNMENMFSYCQKITSLNLSAWNVSKVTNISDIFNSCTSLQTLNVSTWNTSSVTDMSNAFCRCESIKTFDVSKWDVSKVNSFVNCFAVCSKLESIDISKWNPCKATDISCMFSACESLKALDVSNWDVSSVKDFGKMFYKCSLLTSLDVSKWNTINAVDLSGIFENCEKLTAIDVSKWNTANAEQMDSMFLNCKALTTLDLSSFDTSKVIYMFYMFEYCNALEHIYVGDKWNTDNVEQSYSMFAGCEKLPGYLTGITHDKTYAHTGAGGYLETKPPV